MDTRDAGAGWSI